MRYTYDQPDYLDKNGLIHLVDELRGLIEQIVNGNLDVSVYATKEELTAYATKSYVDETVADVSTGGEIDLSNYVTKDTVYTKEETDAMITEIDVITEDEIKALFTTEGYATEEYVSTAIGNIPATDLSNYYTKSEVDALIATDDGGTDSGETEEGGDDTTTPTVTGTSAITGSTTLKVGYNRSYTGKFYDASGTEVTDVIGTWAISDCTFASDIEQTIADNKITLYTENEDIIDETFTLTFSDPNGNYTSSSVTVTVASAF